MQAHIFAEGSNTTAEDPELPIKEYCEGLFGMVACLNDELGEFTEAHLHVLSEEYSVVKGQDQISNIRGNRELPVGADEMVSMAREELLRAATTADVRVILHSTDVFRATVTQLWENLVDEAKPESIWCLGAARSALDELDFKGLDAKGCSALTYQRIGVARIGIETREELLETVKQKVDQ